MLTLLASALAWLRKVNPLVPSALAVALALALAVQTARIEGLLIWPIHINGLKADLAGANTIIANIRAEAKRADRASTIIAGTADVSHTTTFGSNRAATRAYADAHRVRLPTAASDSADHGAPLSTDTAAIPFVVTISEPDLGICSDDHAYAVSAYDWTQSLIAAGLAKPESHNEATNDGS